MCGQPGEQVCHWLLMQNFSCSAVSVSEMRGDVLVYDAAVYFCGKFFFPPLVDALYCILLKTSIDLFGSLCI